VERAVDPETLTGEVKAAARRAGFDLVGIAPASGWPQAARLEDWVAAGYAGEMAYMTRDPAARADPRRRFPWARSVVCVGLNYRLAPGDEGRDAPPAGRRPFSRYAWGDDYHDLVAARLRALVAEVERLAGPLGGRWYVDTGPVLERPAAAAAGLGWLGKNTMLLREGAGSWLFLGEVLLPLDLVPDRAAPGRCGTCTRCLEACPTRAFVAPYLLDARRCISYLTIELRGPIPRDLRPLVGEMVFGCDICQEVCPWNRKAPAQADPIAIQALRPRPGLATGRLDDLLSLLDLTPAGFAARFRGSPVKRARRRGLLRNVCVALGNRGDPAAVPALARALFDPEPLVRGHAAWALGRLGGEAARLALATARAAEVDAWVREEVELAAAAIPAPDPR